MNKTIRVQKKAAAVTHMGYFTALDGFRGVLAVLIAVYHTMWLSHSNSSALLSNGQPLVDLFFVFSGFLMFILYDGRINTRDEISSFIKRRFARVYPLHFFMLIIALLYALARLLAHVFGFATHEIGEILPFQSGANETLWSFFTNLTLTHSLGLHDSLNYNMPSWTVSVEFYTYFVFAAMLMWFRPQKKWHFGVICLLIGVNYYVLSRLKPNMDFHYDFGFWRCLGGFFTGVVIAAVYRNLRPKYDRLCVVNCKRRVFMWGSVIEVLAMIVLFGFIIYFPGKWQFFIAPIAFVFVFVFAFDMGFISRFLGRGLFRYLAKISYSIYMVHVVISLFFTIFTETIMPRVLGVAWNNNLWAGDILLFPYLVSVIVVSHFTYTYIEMLGRRAIMAYNFSQMRMLMFMQRKSKIT